VICEPVIVASHFLANRRPEEPEGTLKRTLPGKINKTKRIQNLRPGGRVAFRRKKTGSTSPGLVVIHFQANSQLEEREGTSKKTLPGKINKTKGI
jgi:hypothetical protein